MPRKESGSPKIIPVRQAKSAPGNSRSARNPGTARITSADAEVAQTPLTVPELQAFTSAGATKAANPAVLAMLTRFNPPWCWHVLYCVHMLGAAGYAELREALPGPSDSVFTARLKSLTASGFLTRTVYPKPKRTSYALGPTSRALLPILEAMHVQLAHQRSSSPFPVPSRP